MSKFKPGDKVKCIRDAGSFFGHLGEEFTVKNLWGEDLEFEEMPIGESPVDANRFELIEESEETQLERSVKFLKQALESSEEYKESELERLVRIANEGMMAENILLTKHHSDIEREHTNNPGKWYSFTHNPYIGYSVYRIKSKPTFKPFYIGEKICCWYNEYTGQGAGHTGPCTGEYLVELKDYILHIGPYTFNAWDMWCALANLTRNSSEVQKVSGHRLGCMRDGICIDGTTVISWKDADTILEALDKSGVR